MHSGASREEETIKEAKEEPDPDVENTVQEAIYRLKFIRDSFSLSQDPTALAQQRDGLVFILGDIIEDLETIVKDDEPEEKAA